MAAHTYYRVLMDGADYDYVFLSEIEMRASAGGADQCAGGSSFGSAFFQSHANCFDNNNATDWQSQGVAGVYVGYQFAAPVDIVEFALRASSTFGRKPRSVTFQYSDTSNTGPWTTIGADTVPTWADGETKVFTITASPTARVTAVEATVVRGASSEARVSALEATVARSGIVQALLSGLIVTVVRANGPEHGLGGYRAPMFILLER